MKNPGDPRSESCPINSACSVGLCAWREIGELARLVATQKRVEYSLYVFIVLLSFTLRIWDLGRASYWVDEMVSVHFAKHPMWTAIFWDNNPFLYFLILKFWIMAFGCFESTTRSLSVVFSVSTTVVLIILGRRRAGPKGGILFGLLHCFSGLSIAYAQETRMYAMFEFSTALSLVTFLEIWRTGRIKRSFLGGSLLLGLSHYLAAIPLAIELIWLAYLKKVKAIFVRLFLGVGTLSISYFMFFSWPHLNWQKMKYAVELSSHLPTAVVMSYCNDSLLAAVAVLVLIIHFLVMAFLKEAAPSKELQFEPRLMFSFVAGSFVTLALFGFITSRGVFLPRYFIFIMPFYIVWLGDLWLCYLSAESKTKIFAIVTLSIYFLGTLAALPQIYVPKKAQWREVVAYIFNNSGPAISGTGVQNVIALTTVTQAVQAPYFEKVFIPLERWYPTDHTREYIDAKLEKYDSLWMVENYFHAKELLAHPEKWLDPKYRFDEKVIQEVHGEIYGDPLIVIHVHRRSAQTDPSKETNLQQSTLFGP